MRPHRSDRYDGALALVIFLTTVVYLFCHPHPLGWADEAYFLYEARRVAEGEVMYRDIFEFVTPGAVYIMALLFRVFGTTMTVAAIATAAVHGLTAALLFASCRQLGVRRAGAALTPIAYLAVSQVTWPYASWHWFSTLVLMLQCWTLLRVPWPQPPCWAVIPGIVSGLALGVQQQRGLPLALAVAAVFIIDHLLARRSGDAGPWPALARRLAFYAAGILLVIVPLLTPSVLLAGIDALIDGWVRFPLENYRAHFSSPWGNVGPLARPFALRTFPTALRWLPPIAMAALTVRAIVAVARPRTRQDTWQDGALLLAGTAAVLSIWYNPDFIHLAFVAPIFFIPVAQAAEWVWRQAARAGMAGNVVLATATVGIAAAFGARLSENMTAAWKNYPIAHETAFGRVHFAAAWEPILIDAVRDQLRASGSLEMFCYPYLGAPYLTTGGRNPTRFQFADAQVLPYRYTEEIVRILWERRVPTLVVGFSIFLHDDPVRELIKKQYAGVPVPGQNMLPPMLLYRYRPDVRLSAPPQFPGPSF